MNNNAPKIKLSFEDEKYYVNEKKGTVTCTIVTFVRSRRYDYDPMLYTDRSGNKDFMPEFKTVGVARFNPEDDPKNWDIETGKRIAESRAKSKAYAKCQRYLEKIVIPKLSEYATSVSSFYRQMEIIEAKEYAHEQRLIDEVK